MPVFSRLSKLSARVVPVEHRYAFSGSRPRLAPLCKGLHDLRSWMKSRKLKLMRHTQDLKTRVTEATQKWLASHGKPSERPLRAGLLIEGRKLVSIKGDGNCFFRAMSVCTYGHQRGHKELRDTAVREMRRHPELYEEFLHEDEAVSVEDYCDWMSRNGVWADHHVMLALCRQLRCSLRLVVQAGVVIPFKPEDIPISRDITLGYYVGNHFVAAPMISKGRYASVGD